MQTRDRFERATRRRLLTPLLLAGLSLLGLLLLAGCDPLPTRPREVTLVTGGEGRTMETFAPNVGELLTEAQITLNDLDRVQPPETSQIRSGMTITVTRVLQEMEVISETLPFGRQVARDASLPQGESRLLQSGRAGVRERIYRITFEDGVEVERVLVQNSVALEPQDEVVLVGTRPQVTTLSITGTLAYLENQDAWLVRGSTANPRRLTALGDLDGQVFALSPTGDRLLFTRPVTEEAHFNALWMVNTVEAGSEPVRIDLNDLLWAGWSPDGEAIAWTTAEVVDRAPGWRGQNDLWTANVAASGRLLFKREVLEPEAGGGYGWWGTRYRWAPSGEALAYARPDQVGVVDLDARERLLLKAFPAFRTYSSWAWEPGVSWTPEGDFLATAVHGPFPGEGDPEESPVFDLWMVEATGAYSAEVASEAGAWTAPRFSPDGETLLFGRAVVPYQSHLSGYTLCAMDRDGSGQRCFFPPEGETGIEIPLWLWSPDGRRIAFIYQGDLHLLEGEEASAIPITDQGRVTTFDWR